MIKQSIKDVEQYATEQKKINKNSLGAKIMRNNDIVIAELKAMLCYTTQSNILINMEQVIARIQDNNENIDRIMR